MYIYICIYVHMYTLKLLNFTSSWDFVFLGNIGYQGQDAIFGAVYAHKGRTKKLKRHGLHGFALDQPSINGIGPINRSEKMKRSETVGNSRKRSETVGNMIRPKLVQPAFFKISLSAQRRFF